MTPILAPIKLLLVDDDDAILTLMSQLLQGSGFSIATAVDGEQAIKLLEEDSFDVVISDMTMPRVDGITLCRRYHEQVAMVMISSQFDEFTSRKISKYCHCLLEKSELSTSLMTAIAKARERFSFEQLDMKATA